MQICSANCSVPARHKAMVIPAIQRWSLRFYGFMSGLELSVIELLLGTSSPSAAIPKDAMVVISTTLKSSSGETTLPNDHCRGRSSGRCGTCASMSGCDNRADSVQVSASPFANHPADDNRGPFSPRDVSPHSSRRPDSYGSRDP